ncbi:alpha/beta hydrolase [Cnuibacter physcomitrellae]|uniref:alpha/beta fold hydrolase n=1 Tax=Cnuibacter physcomitrellae TaxID=1619308 RepID=UPI002175FF43|nr:alpha/beta hydrolase [Cnuibacter physcomitrellae]MCS5498315.1 alpha/beta hydrolase [Cnuibacter physcomitrellae]
MASADPPPFVLLHGGRHGGWCWSRVSRRLRARGHEVFAPSFTGLGDRAHLLAPGIGLDTHIDDVVGLFESHDIRDAVLVAHSYAGAVACRAMTRIHARVRSFVLLDAHMPQGEQSVFDLVGPERAAITRARVAEAGEGWFVPVSDASAWGLSRTEDIAWVNDHVTPQPVKSYEDRLGSTEYAQEHPYTFIECSRSGLPPGELEWQRTRCAGHAERRHRILDASHDAMVSDPDALVGLLIEAVDPPGSMVGPRSEAVTA